MLLQVQRPIIDPSPDCLHGIGAVSMAQCPHLQIIKDVFGYRAARRFPSQVTATKEQSA